MISTALFTAYLCFGVAMVVDSSEPHWLNEDNL